MSAMTLYAVFTVRKAQAILRRYGEQTPLAFSLIEACTEQLTTHPDGVGMDPTPWLALCDLTEECGMSSILREEVESHFGHPSPSPSLS